MNRSTDTSRRSRPGPILWRIGLAALIGCIQVSAEAATEEKPLTPPERSALVMLLYVKGTQTYTCAEANGVLAWGAPEPDATLDGPDGRPVGHHSKGPIWEARDGSGVVGSVLERVPAPRPHAVPWVLLSAMATSSPGVFAGTRYILRRDTVGGVEPDGACASAGQTAHVPYAATYAFYR